MSNKLECDKGFQAAVSAEAAGEEVNLFEVLTEAGLQIEKIAAEDGRERFSLSCGVQGVISQVTEPMTHVLSIVRAESGHGEDALVPKPEVMVFDIPHRDGLVDYMGERAAQPVLDMLELLDRRLHSNSMGNDDAIPSEAEIDLAMDDGMELRG